MRLVNLWTDNPNLHQVSLGLKPPTLENHGQEIRKMTQQAAFDRAAE
jgi:hypothetical protein